METRPRGAEKRTSTEEQTKGLNQRYNPLFTNSLPKTEG